MTSINFHPTYGSGKKLSVIIEKCTTQKGSQWIEIKILEGNKDIGEVIVYDSTEVEVLETV